MQPIASTHPRALAEHRLCEQHVTRDKLMCAEHWRDVPTALQTQVNDAWRAFGRSTSRNIHERLKALRAAQKAATDAVVAQLREKPPSSGARAASWARRWPRGCR